MDFLLGRQVSLIYKSINEIHNINKLKIQILSYGKNIEELEISHTIGENVTE